MHIFNLSNNDYTVKSTTKADAFIVKRVTQGKQIMIIYNDHRSEQMSEQFIQNKIGSEYQLCGFLAYVWPSSTSESCGGWCVWGRGQKMHAVILVPLSAVRWQKWLLPATTWLQTLSTCSAVKVVLSASLMVGSCSFIRALNSSLASVSWKAPIIHSNNLKIQIFPCQQIPAQYKKSTLWILTTVFDLICKNCIKHSIFNSTGLITQKRLRLLDYKGLLLFKIKSKQFTMGRIFILTLFAFSCLLIVQRQNMTVRKTSYSPAPAPQNINEQTIADPNNYYRTGNYDISLAPVPKLNLHNPTSLIDVMSRKKINGFLFVQYNLYKLEINFIDLGYTSIVQINYWTHQIGSHKIVENVGFTLPEDFNEASLNMDIEKKNFQLYVRQSQRIGHSGNSQTVTSFNLTVQQDKTELYVNYTHVRRDDQCATIVREGVISHKCFGGYGYGKMRLNYMYFDKVDKQNKKRLSAFNPKANQTRCAFDGFRASGWDWKWMWMYATGFSKPEFYANGHSIGKQSWIGFNLGSLNNRSQDFLFLNGKIYPIEGLRYKISDQSITVGKNITITRSGVKPEFEVNFQIMHRTVVNKDMGVLKTDMVKGEGHFVGYVVDPEDAGKKIQFYQMSGIVQIGNSFF